MSNEYFAILTAVGEAKHANAAVLGQHVHYATMAVGDGNGQTPIPKRSQTKLVRQVRRAPVNTVFIDPANPAQIVVEQVIPETEGGWWIREAGIFDVAGDLIAVANVPPTYKPLLSQGSGRTQVVRIVLLVANASVVNLKIDPTTVMATRAYVDDRHETLSRSQTALAAVQVDTLHRQVKHDEQAATRDAAVQQTLADLAAGQTQAAQRLQNTERRLADRQQTLTAAFAAMATAQIQTMTRQIEHEHRLPLSS